MSISMLRRIGVRRLVLCCLFAVACLPTLGGAQQAQPLGNRSLVHNIQGANERIEMIVNSSRILSLGQKIPRAQVNNPEVLEVTALSPDRIQVFAKKPGVTQVNLWDQEGSIYTVDVIVYGDVRELSMLLEQQFPNAALKLVPVANGVVLSGFVPEAEQVSRIVRMAEQYYSNVINNMQVGGVQQVMLKVKVMEVSRTKLRNLGVDFSALSGSGDFAVSSISGMIEAATAMSGAPDAVGDTFRFGVVNNGSFFGFLEALRQNDLLKILAEPNLVAVSGRPASFQVGGEFPILVPQSLGTVSIEFRNFGTELDFVPIVLGNGNVRLEIRGRVSEIDNTRSITSGNITVPGLRVREVNTGLEMQVGQTLALAGLVQTRTEAQNVGLPWVSDLPWIGTAFRKVREETNEIELVILVRPELVDAMDPHEVPPGGPGTSTTSPNDIELYWKGFSEVPKCHPDGPGPLPHSAFRSPEEIEPGQRKPEGGSPPPAEGEPGKSPEARRGGGGYSWVGGETRNNWQLLPDSSGQARPRGTPAGPRRRDVGLTAPARPPAVTNPSTRYNPTRPQQIVLPTAPSVSLSASGPGLIGPIGYDVLD